MAENPPNILFLLSDEHSYRAMGHLDPAADGEPVDTPTFDSLAAAGTRLNNTYCQVPLCTPSRLCMLTGMNPMQSGGWSNGAMIAEDRPTMASLLADAGYETCLVGKMHLGGDRQFAGFHHRPYGDLTGETGHQWEPLHRSGGKSLRDRTLDAGVTEIPESQLQEQIVARESLAFLREHHAAKPNQPWFVCASFSRPHFPLTAPRRWMDRYWPDGVTPPKIGREGDTADHPMTRGMIKGFRTDEINDRESLYARAAYFACVSYLDELIGDMLACMHRDGLLDNTIVVYTSDHGELMGEHGVWWKNSWHEGAARVPLLVQTTEQRRGEQPAATVNTPVSLADLLPTFCGFADVKPPDDLDGIDLGHAIAKGVEPERPPVWLTNPQPRWGEGSEHVVVRESDWKYVRFRGMQPNLLFNLADDPLEQRNLVEAEPTRAAAMRAWADQQWDFDAAEAACDRHMSLSKERAMKLPRAGNLYHDIHGRYVDAELSLYAPRVVAELPSNAVHDFPATESEPTA